MERLLNDTELDSPSSGVRPHTSVLSGEQLVQVLYTVVVHFDLNRALGFGDKQEFDWYFTELLTRSRNNWKDFIANHSAPEKYPEILGKIRSHIIFRCGNNYRDVCDIKDLTIAEIGAAYQALQ